MLSPSMDALKNFDLPADRLDVADLIGLSAFARIATDEYAKHGLTVPEWVTDKQNLVAREISTRSADAKAARLKDLKARRAALKTAEEKRVDLDAEIAKLEA